MHAQTPFRIASLSKLMGGALALCLVADGTLELADDVARWLPELAGLPCCWQGLRGARWAR